MNISELTPAPPSRVQFSLASTRHLPSVAGCYALTNFEGEVIYVGLTVNLLQRFKQHRDTPEKCAVTALGSVFWFYFLTAEKAQVNSIERGWLNQYSAICGALPLLNKIESPTR